MLGSTKLQQIADYLEKRYNSKIFLTEIFGGRDKNVYLARSEKSENFIVMCDKKNSLMRNYRTLCSNNLQRELYNNSVYVANVLDIFEKKGIGVIAVQQYLDGKKIKVLDKDRAYQFGVVVAKLHNTGIKPKYFMKDFSLKYIVAMIIKFVEDNIRYYKGFLCDKTYKKLAKGICHRDLNLSNLIFIDNNAYLIDFDRYRIWPFVYEIERFFRYEDSRRFIKDFMQGYISIRSIDKNETNYLI